jgi:hypothetical protein
MCDARGGPVSGRGGLRACAGQVGKAQVGGSQASAAQVGSAQVSMAQVGPAHRDCFLPFDRLQARTSCGGS